MTHARPPAAIEPDPELEALPKPRRPWRRVTLVVMMVTAVASMLLALQLRSQVLYALAGDTPRDLGELGEATLDASWENAWVRGAAELESTAIVYRRPLERDRFRLAPVVGRDQIWVQVRVPVEETDAYIPPSSFVGRLVPFSKTGLVYSGLPDAVRHALGKPLEGDAWLVVDGEAPRNSRWAMALVVMLFGFALFNLWGIYRIVRAPRPTLRLQ